MRQHPQLRGLTELRPVRQTVDTIFFDTPDSFLRRHDMSLMTERVGHRVHQVFVHTGSCLRGSWSRREWRSPIKGDEPALAPLLTIRPSLTFADADFVARLRAILRATVDRTTWKLDENGSDIEIVFGQGQLSAPNAEAPTSDALLHLKRGDAAALYRVAKRLHDLEPFHLSASGPALRGQTLLDGHPLRPRKSRTPNLDPSMTIGAAIHAIARSCAHHLLINHDSLLASGDPEALHQMRVALRRFRSALALLKPRLETPDTLALKAEIRWIEADFGPARDAQVFLAEIFEPLSKELGSEPGFRALRKHFHEYCQRAQDQVMRLLLQPRFTRALIDLGRWTECGDWRLGPLAEGWIDLPASEVAASILDHHSERVAKSMRGLAKLDEATRHRARIRIKKLRYAAEFFGSLFPNASPGTVIVALGQIQDRLGRLNDIAVARSMVTGQAGGSDSKEQRRAASRINARLTAEVGPLLESAVHEWRSYRRLRPFWDTANRKPLTPTG